MLHILKRHPIPIVARIEQAVALTFAVPREILTPLLSPGLELETLDDFGFLAITTVQTCGLRPAFLPAILGRGYLLTSYRLFTHFTTKEGRELRGLQTLRSDTNEAGLVKWGNRLTRYDYHHARFECRRQDGILQLDVSTPHAEADLQITAEITNLPGRLPEGSPFHDLEAARRFVAPLPHTVDYEPETNSIVVVEGQRANWTPQPVNVRIPAVTFFQSLDFRGSRPQLAGAFYLSDIPYRWERGRRYDCPQSG